VLQEDLEYAVKTDLDCLPCLPRQAVEAARLAADDQHRQRLAVVAALCELGRIQPDASPAGLAYGVHTAAACVTVWRDPYCNMKAGCHKRALRLLPAAADLVSDGEEPPLAAAGGAAAGKIADARVNASLDIQAAAQKATSRPRRRRRHPGRGGEGDIQAERGGCGGTASLWGATWIG
jgi:uncharacterized protein with ATP-grasp and redox domains